MACLTFLVRFGFVCLLLLLPPRNRVLCSDEEEQCTSKCHVLQNEKEATKYMTFARTRMNWLSANKFAQLTNKKSFISILNWDLSRP